MIFADYLIEPLRAEKNVFFLGSVVNRDLLYLMYFTAEEQMMALVYSQEKLLLE